MNLKDLYDVETKVEFIKEGHNLAFYFRTATTEEELEFRRRTSMQRIKENGVLESTPTALKAPLWLFEKLLTKITLQNGNGEPIEQPKEDIKYIKEKDKLEAIAQARLPMQKKDNEILGE
jgi:hypothetical protein